MVWPRKKTTRCSSQAVLYFLERFIVQNTQIDAGDFSAERSGDRLDFDPPIGCHGVWRLSSEMLQEGSQPVNGVVGGARASSVQAFAAAYLSSHTLARS